MLLTRLSRSVAPWQGRGGQGGHGPPLKKFCRIISMLVGNVLSLYLWNLKNVCSTKIQCCRKFISCYKCKTRSTVCNIKVGGVVAGGRPIGKFRHFLTFVGKIINWLIQFVHRLCSIVCHDSQKIKYERVQEDRGIQRVHRLQRISTTRWWSHQKALADMCFASSEDL